MAYVEFADTLDRPATAPGAQPRARFAPFTPFVQTSAGTPDGAPELTGLEWRVVELARGDGLATLLPRRERSWLARLILGPLPASPMLADERLEALRRLAVQAWHHGYTLPSSAIKQAISAGYSEPQVGNVIDTIVGRRLELRRAAA